MTKLIIELVNKNKKIIKFVISGCTAATTDLLLLYFFTDHLHIYYITSAIMAFIIAFFISFFMQKYWTFEDGSNDKVHSQMFFYFLVAICNLVINTFGIYWLVEHFHLYYLLAQIIVSSTLGISSFMIYNLVIFKKVIVEKIKEKSLDDEKQQ